MPGSSPGMTSAGFKGAGANITDSKGACLPRPAWCSRSPRERPRKRQREREALTSVESALILKHGRMALSVVSADVEPLAFVFADDGSVPTNPMPFLVYNRAISVYGEHT